MLACGRRAVKLDVKFRQGFVKFSSSVVKFCQGFPWPFHAISRACDAKVDKRSFVRIFAASDGPSPGTTPRRSKGKHSAISDIGKEIVVPTFRRSRGDVRGRRAAGGGGARRAGRDAHAVFVRFARKSDRRSLVSGRIAHRAAETTAAGSNRRGRRNSPSISRTAKFPIGMGCRAPARLTRSERGARSAGGYSRPAAA